MLSLNQPFPPFHPPPLCSTVEGGYTKEERRTIEAELFSGRLLGVTATCALELGVDIGDLDVRATHDMAK